MFYNELSVTNPLYVDGSLNPDLSIENEIRYHIKNLKLLALYFDHALLHTGNLLNAYRDRAVQIVYGTMVHPEFRAMLDLGFVRICGWGSTFPEEMSERAIAHAFIERPRAKPRELLDEFSRVMKSAKVVYRSTTLPDAEYFDYFENRIARELFKLDTKERETLIELARRVQDRHFYIGSLGMMEGGHKHKLQDRHFGVMNNSLAVSWTDYEIDFFRDAYVYQPARHIIDPFQTMVSPLTGRHVLTVALSPFVFDRYLHTHLTTKEVLKILSVPYGSYEVIKNGIWMKFCEMYHHALADITDLIAALDLQSASSISLSDAHSWDSFLEEFARRTGFDAMSFLNALSAVAGVLLTIPFLAPLVKFLTLIFRRTLDKLTSQGAAVRRHADLQFVNRLRSIARQEIKIEPSLQSPS